VRNLNKILATLVALTVLAHVSSFKLELGNVYYGILICTFLLLLAPRKKHRLNPLMAWVVIASFISILLNEIPSFFRSYERFVAFVMLIGLVGPLINNSSLQLFRTKLFATINILIVVMVLISFLGIATGLPFALGRGGFAGVFNHSMILGPMAAIAMLVSINLAYGVEQSKYHRIFLAIAAVAFVTCVAAGSRSALLAGVGGGLFYYYKINQGQLNRYMRSVVAILALLILSFPVWEPYTERISGKMAYAEQHGDVLVSRTALWELRLREFKTSPIVGVGFAAVNTTMSTRFDAIEGKVEPGSSWLAVLSMIGLLGFIPLLLLILGYLEQVYKEKGDKNNSAYLGALLIFFIIHMMAEGYILSAGSGLFFYFWLTLGILEQNKKRKSRIRYLTL